MTTRARRSSTGLALLLVTLFYAPAFAMAAGEYHVGPGQDYTSIGAVPWYALQPGDTVYIHYRPTPYYEKLLISSRGTPTQWIRVIGVPGPNGELPVISGNNATTSSNMHYRWPNPTGESAIQHLGLLQIAVGAGEGRPLPGYIEIANLHLQDAYSTYQFTAENGQTATYNPFAACIYARSAQHLIVRDSVMTNCGQGFYNWTGSGNDWWDGLQLDTVLRGNHFYGNGHVNSYTEHQVYTESDGVIIEFNKFGPNRVNARGSQIKDRSAGTVIRYNYIEAAGQEGWMIDLGEPENGWDAIGTKPSYRQSFIYGNVMISRKTTGSNWVHWNEDHQAGVGRAVQPGAKLFFYNNTVVAVANQSDFFAFHLFNETWGGYECAPPALLPGVIDIRNNIFAVLPRTPGSPVPPMRFGYCNNQQFNFGRNWVSQGWSMGVTGPATGTANLVSPAADPGFVNLAGDDFHLAPGSTAATLGGNLAPEVKSNSLGLDLTPTMQYVYDRQGQPRAAAGNHAPAGAFGKVPNGEPGAPRNVRFPTVP